MRSFWKRINLYGSCTHSFGRNQRATTAPTRLRASEATNDDNDDDDNNDEDDKMVIKKSELTKNPDN